MINNKPTQPKLLNSKQVSDALGFSELKVWKMTITGELPHVQVGRLVMYSDEELNRLLDVQIALREHKERKVGDDELTDFERDQVSHVTALFSVLLHAWRINDHHKANQMRSELSRFGVTAVKRRRFGAGTEATI